MESNPEFLEVVVEDAVVEHERDGYQFTRLRTNRAEISCRYYPVENSHLGTIWVGGVGGDWDSPARELYPQLCQQLRSEKIASLRVRFRHPTQLGSSVLDVLAGISFLRDRGITKLALIGHSFGGAVVIRAAARAESVRTVVALATQAHGTDPVLRLATRCSLLLIHGQADPILPPVCSQNVYDRALEPKRLILYPNAGHRLDEVAEEVRTTVRDWIINQLIRYETITRPDQPHHR